MNEVVSESQGNGSIYYWQKNKALGLARGRGVQFPGGSTLADGFIRSIFSPKSNVKRKLRNNLESKQFKRWFGDWQNDPKHVSKIVNPDETPKLKVIDKLKEIVNELKQKIEALSKRDLVVKAAMEAETEEMELAIQAFEFALEVSDYERAQKGENKKAAEGEAKYSIVLDEQGYYVSVDTNQEIFDGKSTSEMLALAKKIIQVKYKGMVLNVGKNGKAYINKRSAEEYAHPVNRRMDENIVQNKMKAAPELENLLMVSEHIGNFPDDGRHPEATGGWDHNRTRFSVAGEMFTGTVNIIVTDCGFRFYDITKINRVTRKSDLPHNSQGVASDNSIDSISETGQNVNPQNELAGALQSRS